MSAAGVELPDSEMLTSSEIAGTAAVLLIVIK